MAALRYLISALVRSVSLFKVAVILTHCHVTTSYNVYVACSSKKRELNEGRLTGLVTSLRRNCLLKHISKVKIEGRVEVTRRRGRRRKSC